MQHAMKPRHQFIFYFFSLFILNGLKRISLENLNYWAVKCTFCQNQNRWRSGDMDSNKGLTGLYLNNLYMTKHHLWFHHLPWLPWSNGSRSRGQMPGAKWEFATCKWRRCSCSVKLDLLFFFLTLWSKDIYHWSKLGIIALCFCVIIYFLFKNIKLIFFKYFSCINFKNKKTQKNIF